MTTSPVTVAVVSWNTRELLRDCLSSLTPEVTAGRADVWVLDNASSDGSAALVAEAFPEVRLIASEENLGFGRAVNEIARRTKSEWIAAANADIQLEPGAITALLAAGDKHPEAAILAPRLLDTEGGTQHTVHAFPSLGLAAAVALGLPSL